MKPKPFFSLNHFTTPLGIKNSLKKISFKIFSNSRLTAG